MFHVEHGFVCIEWLQDVHFWEALEDIAMAKRRTSRPPLACGISSYDPLQYQAEEIVMKRVKGTKQFTRAVDRVKEELQRAADGHSGEPDMNSMKI